jgi:hypothetical protein
MMLETSSLVHAHPTIIVEALQDIAFSALPRSFIVACWKSIPVLLEIKFAHVRAQMSLKKASFFSA